MQLTTVGEANVASQYTPVLLLFITQFVIDGDEDEEPQRIPAELLLLIVQPVINAEQSLPQDMP